MRGEEEIAKFKDAMIHELAANAHKGHWLDGDPSYESLMSEVLYHAFKLALAAKEGHKGGVIEFSADVANCAMFIADKMKALEVDSSIKGEGQFWEYDLADGSMLDYWRGRADDLVDVLFAWKEEPVDL